jgi:hypothetical protein
LKQDDVRVLRCKPLPNAFRGRTANAVEVQGDNAHRVILSHPSSVKRHSNVKEKRVQGVTLL